MSLDVPRVFVVDDDAAVRESLALLVKSMSLAAETYASAQEFLEHYDGTRPGCLVLDIRMPLMSGLDLQQVLASRGLDVPIIFITGHGDVSMAVQAMRAGAVDFLEKPFKDQDLLDRIYQALELDRRRRAALEDAAAVRARFATLTPREREVLERLVLGQANKVIAVELALSERTVEIHRAKVMSKTAAKSLAELVALVTRLRE